MMMNRSLSRNLHFFLKTYKSEVRFIIRFIVIFLATNFVYFLCDNTFLETFIFSVLTAKPSAAIIQLITPEEHMTANGNLLISDYNSFLIVDGCEGAQSILILVSAIVAFNMPLKHKIKGLIYGVLFLYCMNLARIVMVYYVVRYHEQAFDIAHLYVGQTFSILFSCLFFIFWVRRSLVTNEKKGIN